MTEEDLIANLSYYAEQGLYSCDGSVENGVCAAHIAYGEQDAVERSQTTGYD